MAASFHSMIIHSRQFKVSRSVSSPSFPYVFSLRHNNQHVKALPRPPRKLPPIFRKIPMMLVFTFVGLQTFYLARPYLVLNVYFHFPKAIEKEAVGQLERQRYQREKFLEWNSTREGVVVLKSGLQYKIIQNAENQNNDLLSQRTPTLNDKVVLHFEGQFMNGLTFASSTELNRPIVK
ncbi:peptidyl-prolyl cis-trans isomerase, FKBP-type [Reticulomyxa filosa]|uniref:Peptidyl-prolyl cis-trans isomerase, FKBP-type n=1 Tax=Reticulomyxa filosa TaxID=46433 RepID=X6P8A0_RETFI|nr:peptidyl-prolyl cis-trans isomerase, FKBP-type [Reticulomyxa filosa]|eukprot:ETO33857.1 peptidyl-prolyl cis-trans isomerase, FKBP-type [Reticulomyxa filosa]